MWCLEIVSDVKALMGIMEQTSAVCVSAYRPVLRSRLRPVYHRPRSFGFRFLWVTLLGFGLCSAAVACEVDGAAGRRRRQRPGDSSCGTGSPAVIKFNASLGSRLASCAWRRVLGPVGRNRPSDESALLVRHAQREEHVAATRRVEGAVGGLATRSDHRQPSLTNEEPA